VPEQLVLKVTLAGSRPSIWRRVEVHSGLTLEDLHFVIQAVFAWENSHLYHFLVPPGGKLTRRAMTNAVRYHVLPPDPFFDEEESEDRAADEAMLGRVFTDDCSQIIYEYDFGDSWEHVVKLAKRTPGGEQDHVPVCLAGAGAAPRDDMGGIGGFYEWVAAVHDSSHEMHEEAVAWLRADFDPARFDVDAANARLRATFKPAPKRASKARKGKKK
jgi:hypothetical protein